MLKKWLPIIIILLFAFGLRAYRLTEIPPGLTHDEANHGREAIEILDGQLRYYFPLNYGSEPLYSYVVAGSMALFGENLLALRLVNVIFGLAAIAVIAIWTKQAFNRSTALVTAALIAVSFWPLASSRESLRAGLLPFFMILAVWFFWQIVFDPQSREGDKGEKSLTPQSRRGVAWMVGGFALSIVLTLHIYLAARVSWLLFPAFLIYLAIFHRPTFRRSWQPVTIGLLTAGLLAIPMFVYLANNPESQTRLAMLGGTMQQVTTGNWEPLLKNMAEALLAFVWPGTGDQFLAYNIPGRPVLDLISAVFFIIGILLSIWRWKRPAYAFILLWFATGIIPSLVTGPTANTTRNLAALPAVYLLTALGIVVSLHYLAQRFNLSYRKFLFAGVSIFLLVVGLITARDYFLRWGEAPEVRSAYQHTLVEELAYLDHTLDGDSEIVLSTVYPGPVHDPSIALVLAGAQARNLRWVDARKALIIPQSAGAQAIIPASTPPHPAFEEYLRPLKSISLRSNDFDPEFTFYAIDAAPLAAIQAEEIQANFGGAVVLEQAQWLSTEVQPGDTAELLTRWRVIDPSLAGPIHQPAGTTEAIFFTHILDENTGIIAQNDTLDAPSWNWKSGDTILQLHSIPIPANTPPGVYSTVLGIYDRPSGQRLSLLGNETSETMIQISPLQVAQSPISAQN